MPRIIDLVQTNPLPGREDEFEEWYGTRHIHDILAVPGIVTAQRYRVTRDRRVEGSGYAGMPKPYQHLALYECEGRPDEILKAIEEHRNAGKIPWSPALDPVFSAYFYEPIGEKLIKG